MLPRVALVPFAALVLLTANISHAAPSNGMTDHGDNEYALDRDIAKRDVQDTCPDAGGILGLVWDDIPYDENDYGCHKGYCWSRCAGAAGIFGSRGKKAIYEWCYTTKGSSQDRGYIRCSKKEDCCSTWSCAGPCAAF